MPWIKVDNQLPDNPKIVSVGPIAAWLYVCGLCYCDRLLTDGFIPVEKLEQLVPHTQDRAIHESPLRLADLLCDVGLWKPATRRGVTGFRVHDYLKYQSSKEEIVTARTKNAERQRRFRAGGNGAET